MGDDFPHFKVLLPAALVVTLIINSGWTPWEFLWSYSLWLESISFIPQIVMLNKIRIIENITSHYVACLGLYRFFYILNWYVISNYSFFLVGCTDSTWIVSTAGLRSSVGSSKLDSMWTSSTTTSSVSRKGRSSQSCLCDAHR